MPKRIENPGDPEDYVDGLREKKPAESWYASTPTEHAPVTPKAPPTQPIKDIDIRPHRALRWLWAVAIFMVGMVVHALFLTPDINDKIDAEVQRRVAISAAQHPAQAPVETPAATPEVKVVEKPVLTSECKAALDGMDRVLQNASTIASLNDKQLDIFTETRQAIILKDWRKINQLEDRQRDIERDFASKRIPVVKAYPEIQKDLKSCRSQQSSR